MKPYWPIWFDVYWKMVRIPLFVNRIADKNLKIEDLIENPRQTILATAEKEGISWSEASFYPISARFVWHRTYATQKDSI